MSNDTTPAASKTAVSFADYLDFEKPIAELVLQIESLAKGSSGRASLNIGHEMTRLQHKCDKLKNNIYNNLSAQQMVQLARHPRRPYTLDYIEYLFEDFEELHGDRQCRDDPALLAGIARFDERAVAIVGHQKGRDTKERARRNFGMPKPEGYRKARRLFQLAERFRLPIVTFIDTPGAYPGIDAEERLQSEAIAGNLKQMASLRTPIVSLIIGEGGSGGALAIGVADRLLMMRYSIYSVISPEGCASILWKDAAMAAAAAESLALTSERLLKLQVIDEIVPEPMGGAHWDLSSACTAVRSVLQRHLESLSSLALDDLVAARQQKYLAIGYYN